MVKYPILLFNDIRTLVKMRVDQKTLCQYRYGEGRDSKHFTAMIGWLAQKECTYTHTHTPHKTHTPAHTHTHIHTHLHTYTDTHTDIHT